MYVYILWKKKKVVVQTQLTFETCQMRWYQTDITTYLFKKPIPVISVSQHEAIVMDRGVNEKADCIYVIDIRLPL